MSRFEFEVLENRQIKIKVNSRDTKDKEGKFLDEFTQKSFIIEPKEILEVQYLLTNAAFDFCKKFKCVLDAPECY